MRNLISQYVPSADDKCAARPPFLPSFLVYFALSTNLGQIRLIKYANPLIRSCKDTRGIQTKKLIEMNCLGGVIMKELVGGGNAQENLQGSGGVTTADNLHFDTR